MSKIILKKNGTDYLFGLIPIHYPGDRVYLDGDTTKNVQDKCARKADLTNLDLTGTTNTTGSTISSGTYFYLNGTLVRAKTAIASGATFTENTNYEVATVGDALNVNEWVDITSEITWRSTGLPYKKAIFNPKTKQIKVQLTSDNTGIGNASVYLTLPSKYKPRTDLMMLIGDNYVVQSDVYYTFTTSISSTTAVWHNGRFIFKSSSPRTLALNYNVAQNAYYHQGWAEFYVE